MQENDKVFREKYNISDILENDTDGIVTRVSLNFYSAQGTT